LTGKADGIFTQLTLQFRFSDKKRFEHHLIIAYPIENLAVIEDLGIKYKILPNLKSKFPIIAFFQIISYVKKNRINVLHTHFLKPFVLIGILNLFMRKGCLYNYHGLSFDNLFNNKIETAIYKFFNFYINLVKSYDLIIVPSEESKRRLQNENRFRIPIESYYVGMDINLLSEDLNTKLKQFFENLKNEYLIIGIVARIDIAKRIDNALRIYGELLKYTSKTTLVILGDGDQTDEIKFLMNKMGLTSKVHLLGFVPNARSYIKFFDIFLLTSDYEGFPISIWEAMASGIPIVSSDVGGVKEILENENCGYTYQVRNLNDATKRLLELVEDKSKRIHLGKNGFNAIREKYRTERFIDKMDKIYENLAYHNYNDIQI
jgi:glycosyltransferase involved in cell wall biosynthesis